MVHDSRYGRERERRAERQRSTGLRLVLLPGLSRAPPSQRDCDPYEVRWLSIRVGCMGRHSRRPSCRASARVIRKHEGVVGTERWGSEERAPKQLLWTKSGYPLCAWKATPGGSRDTARSFNRDQRGVREQDLCDPYVPRRSLELEGGGVHSPSLPLRRRALRMVLHIRLPVVEVTRESPPQLCWGDRLVIQHLTAPDGRLSVRRSGDQEPALGPVPLGGRPASSNPRRRQPKCSDPT
jgi:hypothetical protein